jgi:hypothetical protein
MERETVRGSTCQIVPRFVLIYRLRPRCRITPEMSALRLESRTVARGWGPKMLREPGAFMKTDFAGQGSTIKLGVRD